MMQPAPQPAQIQNGRAAAVSVATQRAVSSIQNSAPGYAYVEYGYSHSPPVIQAPMYGKCTCLCTNIRTMIQYIDTPPVGSDPDAPSGPPRYFHVVHRARGPAEHSTDVSLFNATNMTGHVVGTAITFSTDGSGIQKSVLEGDPRFYVDGQKSPQGQGRSKTSFVTSKTIALCDRTIVRRRYWHGRMGPGRRLLAGRRIVNARARRSSEHGDLIAD